MAFASTLSSKLIAGAVALSFATAAAAPAYAWGDREQGIVTGIAGTLLFQGLVNHSYGYGYGYGHTYCNYYHPCGVYHPPVVYRQPVYYAPAPVVRQPVYVAPQSDVYSTPAAIAFNTYDHNQRIRIQASLSNAGYYRGPLDGNFGPGTFQALVAYAGSTGKGAQLDTRSGAFAVLDGLLS